jgi:hypothetical protein
VRCERGVRGATRTTDPASTWCTSSPRRIVKRPRDEVEPRPRRGGGGPCSKSECGGT